jgi:hypothetical protein
LCYVSCGITNLGNITDYYGNLYSGSVGSSGRIGSNCRSCLNWNNRNSYVTEGGSGWYIPSWPSEHALMRECRNYLICTAGFHYSNTECDANKAYGGYLTLPPGGVDSRPKNYVKIVRPTRNV